MTHLERHVEHRLSFLGAIADEIREMARVYYAEIDDLKRQIREKDAEIVELRGRLMAREEARR